MREGDEFHAVLLERALEVLDDLDCSIEELEALLQFADRHPNAVSNDLDGLLLENFDKAFGARTR